MFLAAFGLLIVGILSTDDMVGYLVVMTACATNSSKKFSYAYIVRARSCARKRRTINLFSVISVYILYVYSPCHCEYTAASLHLISASYEERTIPNHVSPKIFLLTRYNNKSKHKMSSEEASEPRNEAPIVPALQIYTVEALA